MSRKTFFNSDTFCVIPFVGLNVLSAGNISYCCFSEEQLIDNDEGLTITNSTLTKAWNSDSMRDIRKKMINGEEHEGCAACIKQEEWNPDGGPRIYATDEWFRKIGRRQMINLFKTAKSNDGYLSKTSPMYLDLRLGNLCNIKCRMCNPWNSSQIDKENEILFNEDEEYKEVWLDEFGYPADGLNEKQKWFEADLLWNDIIKFIPNLQKVYFTGGEPTLIKNNYRFLQECLDQGRKDIVPFFNTNCTNQNKTFYNIITQFDKVDINASLDGVEKMNDYIRFPAKWKAVSKNFESFAAFENVHLGVSPCFQIYNIFNIVDIMKYVEKIKEKYNRDIHIDWLPNTHPIILRVDILPLEIRLKAYNEIKEYYESLDETKLNHVTVQSTKKILSLLIEEKGHDMDKLRQFANYTKSLDRFRKQNFQDSCPRLYEEINNFYPHLFSNDKE